jgi:hypothetical protein
LSAGSTRAPASWVVEAGAAFAVDAPLFPLTALAACAAFALLAAARAAPFAVDACAAALTDCRPAPPFTRAAACGRTAAEPLRA